MEGSSLAGIPGTVVALAAAYCNIPANAEAAVVDSAEAGAGEGIHDMDVAGMASGADYKACRAASVHTLGRRAARCSSWRAQAEGEKVADDPLLYAHCISCAASARDVLLGR
jgi:hypothetical protein